VLRPNIVQVIQFESGPKLKLEKLEFVMHEFFTNEILISDSYSEFEFGYGSRNK